MEWTVHITVHQKTFSDFILPTRKIEFESCKKLKTRSDSELSKKIWRNDSSEETFWANSNGGFEGPQTFSGKKHLFFHLVSSLSLHFLFHLLSCFSLFSLLLSCFFSLFFILSLLLSCFFSLFFILSLLLPSCLVSLSLSLFLCLSLSLSFSVSLLSVSLCFCQSLSLSVFLCLCLRVVLCVVLCCVVLCCVVLCCVVCVVVVVVLLEVVMCVCVFVCLCVLRTLKTWKKNLCVDSKTPQCVHSKRPRVCRHHARMCFNMCAWCRYTPKRFE